jgi:glycerate kinase
MKIVIAPDSFKESLSAPDVAQAIAEGVKRAAPGAQTVCIPMADGGEGTVQAVLAATGGQWRMADVRGALDEPRQAGWGWLGDGRAVIEMATAAGLELIAPAQREPLRASSYGVGQLLRAALDAGATRIILGLGGSSTNDGGAGMMAALGVRFLDAQGRELPGGGGALGALASVDLSGLDPRLAHTRIDVACDVDNPLCGPKGAAHIFGPQKGATPQQVLELDRNLSHYADICARHLPHDRRDQPGAGAAGGLGYAALAFLNADFHPGVELVAEVSGLEQAMQGAALAFTGEGRMDAQTLHGKTPAGVARIAHKLGVPVIALAGSLGEGYDALHDIGITAAFSLASGPMTLQQAVEQTAALLAARAHDATRLWLAAGKRRL